MVAPSSSGTGPVAAPPPVAQFTKHPIFLWYEDAHTEENYLVFSYRGHYTTTVAAIVAGIIYIEDGFTNDTFGDPTAWVPISSIVTGFVLLLLGAATFAIQRGFGVSDEKKKSERSAEEGSAAASSASQRADLIEEGNLSQPVKDCSSPPATFPDNTNLDDLTNVQSSDSRGKRPNSEILTKQAVRARQLRLTLLLERMAYVIFACICFSVIQDYQELNACWGTNIRRFSPTVTWAWCQKGIYSWTIVFQVYPIIFVDFPRGALAAVLIVLIPILQFVGQYGISESDGQVPRTTSALIVRLLISSFLTAYFVGLLYIREVGRRHRYEVYVLLTARRMELLQRRRQVDGLMELLMPQSVVKKLLRKEAAMDVGHRCLVLVTQVHDFMSWSYSMLPALVVQAIDVVYSEFDLRVSREFGLTKVKAIGESYICVSGLGNSSEEFTEESRAQSSGNVSLTGPVRSTNTVTSNDSAHLSDVRTPLAKKFGLDVAAPIRFALFQIRTAQNVRNGPLASTPSPLSNLAFKAGLASSRCVGFLAVTGKSLWYEVAGLAVEVALAVASTAPRDTLLVTPQVRSLCDAQLTSAAADPASSMFLSRVQFQEGPLAYYRGGILSCETNHVHLLSRPVPVATAEHPGLLQEAKRDNDSSSSTAAENGARPEGHGASEVESDTEGVPQEQEPSTQPTEHFLVPQPASASLRSVGPIVEVSSSTDPAENSADPHQSTSNPVTDLPLTPLTTVAKRPSIAPTTPTAMRWESDEGQQLPKQKKSVTDRRLVFLILAEEAEQRKLAESAANNGSSPIQSSTAMDRAEVRSQGTESVSTGVFGVPLHNPNSEGKAMAVIESELSRQEQILRIQRNGNAINDPKSFSAMFFRRFPSQNVEDLFWHQIGQEGLRANKAVYWPFLMALASLFLLLLVVDGSIHLLAMILFTADLMLITCYLLLSLRWDPPRQLDIAVVVCFHVFSFTAMNSSHGSFFTSQVMWVQVVLTIVSVFTSRRSSWLAAAGQSIYLGVAPIIYEQQTLGSVVASTWIASPVCAILSIRFAYVSEVTRRRMFIDELLDSLLFKEASEEVKLQRRLLEMVVPSEVVDLVAQKVAGERSPIIETMSDVCLGLLRFDDLFAEASTAVVINPFAAMTAVEYRTKLVERFCYPRMGTEKSGQDRRSKGYRGLSTIYSVGDRMLIGGPIFGDRARARSMHGSAMVASKMCVGRDADTPVSRGLPDAAKGPGPALGSRLAAEDALLNSALLLLRLVRHLDALSGCSLPPRQDSGTGTPTQSSFGFTQLSSDSRTPSDEQDDGVGRFTALLDCGTAFAAIIGSQQPTFTLLGPATRRVECIMSAAEPGFKGMTLPYARLISGGRRRNVALNPLLDEPPAAPSLASPTVPPPSSSSPCLWKVKGVGLVTVKPLPM